MLSAFLQGSGLPTFSVFFRISSHSPAWEQPPAVAMDLLGMLPEKHLRNASADLVISGCAFGFFSFKEKSFK